jgi:hypothetical protein
MSRRIEIQPEPRVRYTVSGTAGSRNGRQWAVLDTQDKQAGKGMRRVAFYRTPAEARAAAKRMNLA